MLLVYWKFGNFHSISTVTNRGIFPHGNDSALEDQSSKCITLLKSIPSCTYCFFYPLDYLVLESQAPVPVKSGSSSIDLCSSQVLNKNKAS